MYNRYKYMQMQVEAVEVCFHRSWETTTLFRAGGREWRYAT